ncbi:MAG: paraquat-inducible protein A [Loktanella sp.]|jgi:paraquat-inducible protein A|nr:paraquat-inducible protein A [Yoonia sp.]MDO7558957.1 paraquat-inducible protein A [Loktanella sp.]MDO7622928.1 paraquat-inducible protein A [Loktanella sp.]MDO7626466.1 paraquat-inducible protein A [Loktanella sp.]MDO7665562.1 paraquat-inducible protein A [Loktanella sp.]
MRKLLIGANLALLIAFPIAWFAPLMRAGFLPLFSLSEISVISGLQSLWGSDVFLALMVTIFALFAPYLKTMGLALIHFNLLSDKLLPVLAWLGKLAMADVFLIALYIVVAKGVGIGKLETAWGLYLFSVCIIASIAISALTPRILPPAKQG